MCLLQTVMISRKKASEKMKLDPDPIAQEIGDRIDLLNVEQLNRLGIAGNNWKKINDEQRIKSERIVSRQNNRKPILTMFDSKISRDWIWTDSGLTLGGRIRSIQVLSNTSPYVMSKPRGEADMRLRKCRQCKEEPEDDQHILNKSRFNKGLMTKRHDYLIRKIRRELMKINTNAKIWVERTWRNERELVRPDKAMVDNKKPSTVVEVTCRYVHQRNTFFNEKRKK